MAAFLGGSRPVTIAAPPSSKQIEIKIVVPVEDMSDLDAPAAITPEAGPDSVPAVLVGPVGPDGSVPAVPPPPAQRSIWPHVEERVLDLIEQHRSTIVFANSRRLAERLCGRLNELAAERAEEAAASEEGIAAGGPRHTLRRSWPRPAPRRAHRPRSPGPTTARCPGRSGSRSRRR